MRPDIIAAKASAISHHAEMMALRWHKTKDLDQLARDAKTLSDKSEALCKDSIQQLRVMRGVSA